MHVRASLSIFLAPLKVKHRLLQREKRGGQNRLSLLLASLESARCGRSCAWSESLD